MYVELKNINKTYGDYKASDNVSFGIEKGKLIGLLGPSGSGKTTILRMIAGLEQPDSGEIIKQGDVGLVFQNFNLFPHYSVLRNVMEAPVCVAGVPKKQAEEKARELLKKLGLETKADAYPCELSGGQSQRVSIARALALEPKILFFDEPTSALDPELTGEVLKVIKSLTDLNITMVIVTHEMAFAKEISDRIIFMDKGVIIEDASPDEVFSSDNERTREFLGKYHDVN